MPVFIHVEHSISEQKRVYHILSSKVLSVFTDKIVCVSQNALNSYRDILRVSYDKLITIDNGLDVSRFHMAGRNISSFGQKKRVGVVANFSMAKGHLYLVDAATQIVNRYRNIEFILVGDGPLRHKIQEKVHVAGLKDYFQFLGSRRDVGDLLKTFDIFLLPSVFEGLPISLLEAQFFGLATVATNVGGIPEVIKDGYNGLLIPPRDPSSIANAVLRLLMDDHLRNKLGIKARNVFNSGFTLQIMVEKYLNLIYSLSV